MMLRTVLSSPWRRAALAVIASGLVPHALGAQEVTDAPAGRLTEFRSGAVSFAPTFQLVNVGIDSNVYNSTDGAPRTAAFTTTLQPGADVRLTTSQFTVAAVGHAGFVYYPEHASERAVNPAIAAGAERRIGSGSRVLATANAGWRKEREGFEIDSRVRSFAHGFTTKARVARRRVRFDLGATYAETRYDDEARFDGVQLSDTLDRLTRGADLGLGYRLSPYTWVTVAAAAMADRFPGAAHRNTDSGQVTVGVELHPRALIAGNVAVGYRLTRPLQDATEDFSGVVARGGVSGTWKDRVAVSGGVERNVDYSYQPNRFYFVYELYEAAVRQALWRRLDAGARGSWTRLSYGSSPSPSPEFGGRDNEYLTEIGLTSGIRLRRGSRVGVYVSQWERRAGQRPYKTLRSGIELTLGKASVSERGVFLSGPGR